MNQSNKTISIHYGFAEGPQIGRGLVKILKANDYTVTSASKVVIAHSGGMYLLSDQIGYDTVLIVAPSLGRETETSTMTQLHKTARDINYALRHARVIQLLDKLFWNLLYIILRIPENRQLVRRHSELRHRLPTITARRVIVVTYPNDRWSNSLTEVAELPPGYELITWPYEHDDLWYNPQRYLALLAD